MAMYPLFAVPASRTRRPGPEDRGRTPPSAASNISLRPSFPCLCSKEVGGGWSYIFFVSPNFYFYIMAEFQFHFS